MTEHTCETCGVPTDVFDGLLRELGHIDPKCLVEYGAVEGLRRIHAELVSLREQTRVFGDHSEVRS